jgi:hypothetical protein
MEKNDELMHAHIGLPPRHQHRFMSTEIDFGNILFIKSLFHNTGSPTSRLRSLYTSIIQGAGYAKITTS